MASSFALAVSSILADKYEVVSLLGRGWEGEVYKIKELDTKVERAAKIFFPQRNVKNKSAIAYAQKLHRLRKCPVILLGICFLREVFGGAVMGKIGGCLNCNSLRTRQIQSNLTKQ